MTNYRRYLNPGISEALAAAYPNVHIYDPEKKLYVDIEGNPVDFRSHKYGSKETGWNFANCKEETFGYGLNPDRSDALIRDAYLINGDKKTGIGIMYMEETLDTGPILLQEKINHCLVYLV